MKIRKSPLERPADRARRLVYLVLAGVPLLVLALWNPVTAPGPIICMSRRVFGIPCPFCGVTRGVALFLRGQPLQASAHNPLTVLVLLAGIGLAIVWSVEYVRNVRIEITLSPIDRWLLGACLGLAIIGSWIYLLIFRREDDFASSFLAALLRLIW